MDINYMQILFIFNSISVVLLGFSIKIAEPYLPVAITKLFRYGRFAAKETASKIPSIEVPKRWFKHFYEFAAPASTYVLFIALYSYLGFGRVPYFFYPLLDLFFGENRTALVSSAHTTLALSLLTIQCLKRFYETHFISIFSNAKMNLGHYILGFVHYFGALLSLIADSEGFVKGSFESQVNWNQLNKPDYLFALIFLWASYKQLESNIILSNLRKNKKGEVITLQHKIPRGGLFDYISSPLQFTEIIMYFMLTLIVLKSITHHFIFAWVFVNQMGTGLFGHWWYVEKFRDYPKNRKAVIPWIL